MSIILLTNGVYVIVIIDLIRHKIVMFILRQKGVNDAKSNAVFTY